MMIPDAPQVYGSGLEYNGMALATKAAAELSPARRRVYPQQYEAGIRSSITGLTAAEAVASSSSPGRHGDGPLPRAKQTALAMLPGGIAPQVRHCSPAAAVRRREP